VVCHLVMSTYLGDDWVEVVEETKEVCLKLLTGRASVAVAAILSVFVVLLPLQREKRN